MSFHQLPEMTKHEVWQSAADGNGVARTLAPLSTEREFRFPFAVVNVANREGFNSAVDTALELARGPVAKRDAEAWVRTLLKPATRER